MELTAQVREVNGVPVVGLSGELDMRASVSIRNSLLSLLEKGVPGIVINLDNVDYVDSTGLGTMVGILKRADEQRCRVYVVCSNPYIHRVFRITGLDNVFSLRESEREALSSFGAQMGSPVAVH